MKIPSPFVNETTTFPRSRFSIAPSAVVVWLSACLFDAVLIAAFDAAGIPMPAMTAALITVAAMIIAFLAVNRYEKTLEARCAARHGGPVWEVRVDGIAVGTLKDADYAAIEQAIYFNGRLYAAQFISVVFMLGFRSGVVNPFSRERGNRIRRALACATDGVVTVSRLATAREANANPAASGA